MTPLLLRALGRDIFYINTFNQSSITLNSSFPLSTTKIVDFYGHPSKLKFTKKYLTSGASGPSGSSCITPVMSGGSEARSRQSSLSLVEPSTPALTTPEIVSDQKLKKLFRDRRKRRARKEDLVKVETCLFRSDFTLSRFDT